MSRITQIIFYKIFLYKTKNFSNLISLWFTVLYYYTVHPILNIFFILKRYKDMINQIGYTTGDNFRSYSNSKFYYFLFFKNT